MHNVKQGFFILPVQSAPTVKVTYYHSDELGSPVAATNEQGEVVWRQMYRPYGSKLVDEPANATNKIDHTGHLFDKDLGLVYAGARYYDPEIGRFMSMDPVGFNEGNVQSFNNVTNNVKMSHFNN